jgi:gliding motility-associated-like protein
VNYSLNGCNSLPATSTITVKPLPIATFTSNVTEGCVPLSVTFTADDPANTDYTWTTSNSLNGNGASSTINFQSSGDFNVSLTTNLNGCIVTETANSYIQVDDYPIASFSSSVLVFSEQNQFVQFENNSIGAASYSWSFGDGQISTLENPDHIFLSTDKGTTILLTAISLHGCTDTVSFEIPFDPGLIYYIPNSFTPDGDMFNQTFQPVFSSGIDPYNYKLRIYNRWGEIIFESNDLSIGWDGSYGLEGTKCQTGTYTYEIIMKMPNFDERTKITGTVNLIR